MLKFITVEEREV